LSRLRVTYLVAAVSVLATLATTVALAASAPTVSTGAAQGVTDASANLTGTVNPNGQATQYAFQWGPTSGYGHETTLTSAGSGTANESVIAGVSGLAAGSTYHYRIIAISSAGTSVGADTTFTTTGTAPAPSTAPTVSTQSASSVTGTSATVSGSVNPAGHDTQFVFEYGPTSNYGYQTTPGNAGSGTSSVSESAALADLDSGTTYHYRIVAYSAGGTTLGTDRTFTTSTPPTPVTGSATGIDTSEATLSGLINPNGHTTSYQFQFGTTPLLGLTTPPAGIGSGNIQVSVHQIITGLAASTTYYYRLIGTSSNGTGYGVEKTFKTSPSSVPNSQARLLANTAFVAPNNVVGIAVGCFGGQTSCTGKLTMTVGKTTYATRNFTLAADDGGFVHTTISRSGRKTLFSHYHGPVKIRVNLTMANGQRLTSVLHFALYS
jgi:phosphodiesterase/alkaline phosphatase D-like protein